MKTSTMNKPLTVTQLTVLVRLAKIGKPTVVRSVLGHQNAPGGARKVLVTGRTVQSLVNRGLVRRVGVSETLAPDGIEAEYFDVCKNCGLPLVPYATNWYATPDGASHTWCCRPVKGVDFREETEE